MDYLNKLYGTEDPHAKAIRLLRKENSKENGKNWKKFTDRTLSSISYDKESKKIFIYN